MSLENLFCNDSTTAGAIRQSNQDAVFDVAGFKCTLQPGILDEAKTITGGDRRRDYDKAEANHQRIATLWNAYIGIRKEPLAPISPLDAATMMILLKIARNAHTPKRDNFVDIAGYARCGGQIAGFEES